MNQLTIFKFHIMPKQTWDFRTKLFIWAKLQQQLGGAVFPLVGQILFGSPQIYGSLEH